MTFFDHGIRYTEPELTPKIQNLRRHSSWHSLRGRSKVSIEDSYLEAVQHHLRRSEKTSERCLIVSVMGPPGAGKTTLIKRLQENKKTRLAAFYIEDGSANPHLGSGFDTDEDFDADASQRWFLDQYTAFFEGQDRQSQIFLDQDPCAVGLVYSKTFRACGALTEGAYVSQLETLLDIESMMSKISACRKIIAFEARRGAARTLRSRRRKAPGAETHGPQAAGFHGKMKESWEDLKEEGGAAPLVTYNWNFNASLSISSSDNLSVSSRTKFDVPPSSNRL